MAHSSALYRPSILELAREGNFRAIAVWISSLLAPYGISVRAFTTKSGRLNLLVDFRQPAPRRFYRSLQEQLVGFICYRLWTLNSPRIRTVQIVARRVGDAEILWKQSVRIVTPANSPKSRRTRQGTVEVWRRMSWMVFQMLRSLLLSRVAVAGFFLCYWILYWELSSRQALDGRLEAATPAANMLDSPTPTLVQGQNQVALAIPGAVVSPALPPLPHLEVTAPKPFQGEIVYQANLSDSQKYVALTFDDGPWQDTTEQVLDILRENDIRATFFMLGLQVQQHPEIAKKVAEAGHALGNHTWRHLIQDMDEPLAVQELSNAARLIYEATGVRTQLMRPPGGNLTGALVPYARQNQQTVTMWSADSKDYYVSAPLIIDNVLSHVKPGGIVLLHDGGGDRSATVQALPQIISALKSEGYEFVTVPELLEKQAESAPLQATGAEAIAPPAVVSPPSDAAPASPEPLTPGNLTPEHPVPEPVPPGNPPAADPNPSLPLQLEPMPTPMPSELPYLPPIETPAQPTG